MSYFQQSLSVEQVVTPTASKSKGSMIFGIAAQFAKCNSGREICNQRWEIFDRIIFIPKCRRSTTAYRDGLDQLSTRRWCS